MATQRNSEAEGAMDKRKRTYASNATVYALFTIGAIVAREPHRDARLRPARPDAERQVYTLSPASKDIVRNLPDYLTVKAYISKDLPPELATVSRYVRDLMDEYRSASKGKLRFEAFDPGADKKIEDEATACKVNKLQIQVMRSQKFEVEPVVPGPLLPVQRPERGHPGGHPGRGARVPGDVAHQAHDAEEAQGRLHDRPRRAGPEPGLHLPQAHARAGVRRHGQPVGHAHRRRRRRAGRRRPQAGLRRQGAARRSTPSS